MSFIEAEIDDRDFRALNKVLADTPRRIPKEATAVTNRTARQHMKDISKKIRQKIAINVKGSKEGIWLKKDASPGSISAIIQIDPMFRPSLKRFTAKQNKTGVSYKIEKQGGRQTATSAFGPDIPKLNGHVFKRKGVSAFPLEKLHGVSNWGTYTENDWDKWSKKETAETMEKEIEKRIRYVIFRNQQKALRR